DWQVCEVSMLNLSIEEIELSKKLTGQQRDHFLSQIQLAKKESLVYYLLWFFTGGFGGHRFYMGEVGVGGLYCLLTLTSILVFPLLVLVPLWLVDGVKGKAKLYDANQRIDQQLVEKIKIMW